MYGFIYLTTNNLNGKKYIGQKKYDKNGVWKTYLGSGINIQRAIKKYGAENFTREILEECETKEFLDEREKYWITFYDATNNRDFYNIASGGDGGNTTKGYTKEQKAKLSEKISKQRKGKMNLGIKNGMHRRVICLNNMKIFDTTVEAAKYADTTDTSIQACCNHYKNRTSSGYDPITKERLSWEYYYEDIDYSTFSIPKCLIHRVQCINTGKICRHSKEAAEEYNIKRPSSIIDVCKGKLPHAGRDKDGNFLFWKYV